MQLLTRARQGACPVSLSPRRYGYGMRVRSEQQTAGRQVVESADELLPAGWFLWKERFCDQIHCSDAGGVSRPDY